jgi:hypothetical protein
MPEVRLEHQWAGPAHLAAREVGAARKCVVKSKESRVKPFACPKRGRVPDAAMSLRHKCSGLKMGLKQATEVTSATRKD